jgi:AcrR family transcriptional regulator
MTSSQAEKSRLVRKNDRTPSAEIAPARDATLRSDAARNLSKVLAAARATFYEDGIDASVETIARRAGVGMGTLYRRFPSKESLIDAVLDELLRQVLAAATDALECESPDIAFTEFLQRVCQIQAEHAGCLGRMWSGARKSPVRREIEAVARLLLARAQEAGSIRADVVYEDVILLHWSVRGVIETAATAAPEAWARHLDLMLAALAPSSSPLPHPPLNAAQVEAALSPPPAVGGSTDQP